MYRYRYFYHCSSYFYSYLLIYSNLYILTGIYKLHNRAIEITVRWSLAVTSILRREVDSSADVVFEDLPTCGSTGGGRWRASSVAIIYSQVNCRTVSVRREGGAWGREGKWKRTDVCDLELEVR